ncbi:hypothetical protein C7999DRAFT_13775 [Corynascus novoguineensis]|uniref:Protein kinase domain-containing protein n=1 Tax=Corynascus novoguineensis TaxID=1126955 RepID=A0AAN7CTT6_9PEZI|nr:hypothetical protein C7999DRAFT_13775 [Corynascus novoguineensis]
MDWKPPANSEKPHCPNMAGFEMAVTLHTSPPPFGGGSYRPPGARPADGYDKMKDAGHTQTRYCNSPAPTPRSSLVIESVVRGGDKAGPQVVVCHWDNDPSKTRYLAKIYNPLYYVFEDTEHRGVPTDVVWHAARDYSVEAAAYDELKAYETRWAATAKRIPQDESKNIRGCYPAYFGSFAFKLKVVVGGLSYTRTVPLLLTEYLQGPSMEQMIAIKNVKNPNGRGSNTVIEVPGTDDARIHAFARAADSYLKLAMAGVMQADLAPRNIFLLGNLNSLSFRAVISDFNVTKVFSRMSPPRTPPKLADPISFCADPGWEVNFRHWLPAWFFTNKGKRNSQLRIEFPSGKL